MLNWRSLNPSTPMVKGTELDATLYGPQSRFQIVSVRCYDTNRMADVQYRVRDAHTVNDDAVRAGIRPKIVGTFNTLDEAIEFCNSQA